MDFGGQDSSGSNLETTNGIWESDANAAQLAEYFVYGYDVCGPPNWHLTLDVGTNNSISVSSTTGSAFATNVVAPVASYANSYSNGHVSVNGANDIETWGYAGPSAAYNWVSGFSGHGLYYVNFGSANGCSWTGYGSCDNGWSQTNYYYVSWGAAPALVAPEIYYNVNAQQWYWISNAGGGLNPEGPLDEYDLLTSTNTSSQAWAALNQYFPYMSYSLEMHRWTASGVCC